MNVYEFLTQSPKEIGKALKAADIIHWKSIPDSVDKLCKQLNLEKDERVAYYYPIHRSGGTQWCFHLKIDFGFGPKNFEVEFWVKGKCSIVYTKIGSYHTWADIYDKTCPLFDSRPEYHNLELRIDGREYVNKYEKEEWGDKKEYPIFDNDKPLSEYIKIIADKAEAYTPYILKMEEACFNDEYIKSYNKYHFNAFKPGDMIFCEGPGFSSCVKALYNAKQNFDVDLTLDNLQGIYRYMFIHIKELREYNNAVEKGEKPLASYVHDLFWEGNVNEGLTKEMLLQLIELGDAEGLIDKNKKSWDSVYLEANRDLFKMIEKAKEQLSKKHGIPVDYIGFFNYDETTDTADAPEVPEELKDKFK